MPVFNIFNKNNKNFITLSMIQQYMGKKPTIGGEPEEEPIEEGMFFKKSPVIADIENPNSVILTKTREVFRKICGDSSYLGKPTNALMTAIKKEFGPNADIDVSSGRLAYASVQVEIEPTGDLEKDMALLAFNNLIINNKVSAVGFTPTCVCQRSKDIEPFIMGILNCLLGEIKHAWGASRIRNFRNTDLGLVGEIETDKGHIAIMMSGFESDGMYFGFCGFWILDDNGAQLILDESTSRINTIPRLSPEQMAFNALGRKLLKEDDSGIASTINPMLETMLKSVSACLRGDADSVFSRLSQSKYIKALDERGMVITNIPILNTMTFAEASAPYYWQVPYMAGMIATLPTGNTLDGDWRSSKVKAGVDINSELFMKQLEVLKNAQTFISGRIQTIAGWSGLSPLRITIKNKPAVCYVPKTTTRLPDDIEGKAFAEKVPAECLGVLVGSVIADRTKNFIPVGFLPVEGGDLITLGFHVTVFPWEGDPNRIVNMLQ